MFILDTPTAGDQPAIEDLLNLCFGADRQRKTSYHFRDGVDDVADLRRVARMGGKLVGTIIYTPVSVGSSDALLLGPVAVCPNLRGRKIGQTLIWQTLILAQEAGHERVVLVGDESYYNQFGFQPAANFTVSMADEPDRLLALPLCPGGFDGVRGTVNPVVAGDKTIGSISDPQIARPASIGRQSG